MQCFDYKNSDIFLVLFDYLLIRLPFDRDIGGWCTVFRIVRTKRIGYSSIFTLERTNRRSQGNSRLVCRISG